LAHCPAKVCSQESATLMRECGRPVNLGKATCLANELPTDCPPPPIPGQPPSTRSPGRTEELQKFAGPGIDGCLHGEMRPYSSLANRFINALESITPMMTLSCRNSSCQSKCNKFLRLMENESMSAHAQFCNSIDSKYRRVVVVSNCAPLGVCNRICVG